MYFARGDVRAHTILAKIDHEPSCRRYSALQRPGGSIFDFGNSIGQEGTSTSLQLPWFGAVVSHG